MASFTAQVHKIVARNQALLGMVAQESVQRLITRAQTPKAKSGNMPLVTGFLRASGRFSYTGMPSGPVRPPEGEAQTYSAPDTVTLAGFKLGVTVYWGWTAIYARRQETYNDFLGEALRQWQKIVDGVVRDLRNRMK